MTPPLEQLSRLIQEVLREDDALHALELLVDVQAELEQAVRLQVARALEQDRSFAEVAAQLGISRQAAHRRFRHMAPSSPRGGAKRRLAATDEATRVLHAACEEATAAGAPVVAGEHVVLAILRVGGTAADALREWGVTLESTRARVRALASAREPGAHHGRSRAGVRSLLLEATHIAAARGNRSVDSDVLLLAALAEPAGGARTVLTTLGVRLPVLRRRLAVGVRGEDAPVPLAPRRAS